MAWSTTKLLLPTESTLGPPAVPLEEFSGVWVPTVKSVELLSSSAFSTVRRKEVVTVPAAAAAPSKVLAVPNPSRSITCGLFTTDPVGRVIADVALAR